MLEPEFQITEINTGFIIGDDTSGDQIDASSFMDPRGEVAILFVSNGVLSLDLYAEDGEAINKDIEIGEADASSDAAITLLTDGNYAIVWEDKSSGDVVVRIVDPSGQSQVGPVSIGSGPGGGDDAKPVIAVLPDGNLVAAWLSDDGIDYRFLTDDGVPIGAAINVESSASENLSIAPLSNGNFAITYNLEPGGVRTADVLVKIISPTGSTLNTIGVAQGTADIDNTDPVVTATENGGFTVAWAQTDPNATSFDQDRILARSYDSAGNILEFQPRFDQTSFAAITNNPDIADLYGDFFVGTYNENATNNTPTIFDGGDLRLFSGDLSAQFFDGGTSTVDAAIDSTGDGVDGLMGSLRVTGNGTDRVLVTYEVDNGSDIDTMGRLFSLSAFYEGTADDDFVQALEFAENINLGFGTDTVSYSDSMAAVFVNLDAGSASGGFAQGDTLLFVDNLIGSAFDDTLTGNDDDNVLEGGAGADDIDGGNGTDTASYANAEAGVTASLVSGGTAGDAMGDTFSSIENLIGSAFDDTLTGNSQDNVIIGGAGTNILEGGGGTDTISYAGLNLQSISTISLHDGTASTFSSNVPFSDTLSGFENVIGSRFGETISGDVGANVLDGGDGTDIVSYRYASEGATVRLDLGYADVGAVRDTLISFESAYGTEFDDFLQLPDQPPSPNTQNELRGYGGDDELVGGSGNNILRGGDGDDAFFEGFSSSSGIGADTMYGGDGDDIFQVTAGDIVIELAGEGEDTVVARDSYTLTDNVENLRSNSGADGRAYTGNGLDNNITTRDGNDTLDGRGGADTMTGGSGDDSYVVDNAGDMVIETAASRSGDDTVFTSISYDVPVNVEVLIMTGSADINSNGNDARDIIIGNDGDNIIDGAGGFDVMAGGAGNDTYAVDNSSDAIIEEVGAGQDAVYSSVNYQIDEAQEIETAILTGNAVILRGSSSNNQLFGNDQVNVLEGKGGTDYLLGLGGDDIFQVSLEKNAADLDVFGDFEGAGVAGGDRIAFDAAIWGADGIVQQVSQTSFIVSRADGSNAQQFIIANLTDPTTTLIEGDDYYFG